MSDDTRRRRSEATPQPNAIIASAELLTQRRVIDRLPEIEGWQGEAWDFFDTIGEVRFAASWFANALSRGRLVVAWRGEGGDEPRPIAPMPLAPGTERPAAWPNDADDEGLTENERRAFDQMQSLAGGTTGQGRLLADFGVHLSIPGVAYLVGEPSGREVEGDETPPPETWQVVSQDEIKATPPPNPADPLARTRYSVRIGDGERDDAWRMLAADALVVRVVTPHPRYHYRPDSPMRAALPVLRELKGLTQHVDASIASRLAGAGVLLVPKEVTFAAPGVDPKAQPQAFVDTLIQVASTAMRDRDSAAAFVPIVLQVPGETIDKIKHLTFSTELSEQAMGLRDEAIRRFAASIDLPAEVVMGLGDANHWTAWQIEESAIKLHVEPMLEAICHALTIGYLHPALTVAGVDEATRGEFVVWYDVSELTVRPDRSGDAKDLYDRNVIGDTALRRETGFDEGDAPTDDDQRRKMLIDVLLAAPTLAPVILPLIGIEVDFPDAAEVAEKALPPAGGPSPAPTAPAPEGEPSGGPPETRDAPPPAPDEAALLAACDGLVYRAMERAGNRLVNALRREGIAASAGDRPEVIHAGLDDDTRAGLDLDALLDGAWDRVPEIADRYGVEPLAMCATLDAYARTLISTGWPHSVDRLGEVIGTHPVAVAA